MLMLGIGGVAAVGAGAFSRAVFMPRSQICGRVLFRGSRSAPARIALTFDDGPQETITPEILDCLRDRNEKATFFVVGKHAAARPHLIERIHAEGHIVGNHSFEHAHLGSMRGFDYWQREIGKTDALIEQIIGHRPALFRPPMGFKTFHIMRAAKQHGHTVVTWSRRGYDGVHTTPQRIVSKLRDVSAGDIVLLHDGAVAPFQVNSGATVQALQQLLDIWNQRGICMQPLDALLGIPAYQSATLGTL